MSGRHILAWDLGTSGAKVGIATLHGEILASEFEPVACLLMPNGGAEQEPEAWWRALSTATLRLLQRSHVPAASIVAVAVTAQWSGTVPVDAEGCPLMNALIWLDARGAPIAREITGGPLRVLGYSPFKLWHWMRLTGGAPGHAGKDPLGHILWLKHARPDIYERTHKFLEPKDYLTFRLTGRMAASFDSIALHWLTDNREPNSIDYHPKLLELAGLSRDKFPDLCGAPDVLGRLTPEQQHQFGLGPEVVVVAGAADVHSAAVGAGTTGDFDHHLYIGTSSWLSCHVPWKKTDVLHNLASLPAAIPGRYLLLNEQQTAGACLEQLSERLFFASDALGTPAVPHDVFARFDELAADSEPGSRGLLFTPWLYGERTPAEDARLRASLFGYSLDHQRSDVVRAVLEGVALNSRWLLQYVERFAGRPAAELRFIGGGAKSAVWSQIVADVMARPVCRVADPARANLRGAALIAAVGLGEIGFDDVPALVPTADRWEPRSEYRALYDERFDEFLQLYRVSGRLFARRRMVRTTG